MPAINAGNPFNLSLRQTITQTEILRTEVQEIREQYAKHFVTAVSSSQTDRLIERAYLLNALTDHYNIEEINKLCFILDINHEEIGTHKTSAGHAMDLLEYAERHNLTSKLTRQVKKERPFLFAT